MNGKIELPIFLTRVTCLPVSARTQHRSFIKTNLTNIPPPVTFENIWSILLGLFQLWTVHVFWILDPIVNFLVFIYFAFWTPIVNFCILHFGLQLPVFCVLSFGFQSSIFFAFFAFWVPIVNFVQMRAGRYMRGVNAP